MKGMLHLWQQVILIQHTDDESKLLIQIKEDWQESNHFFMTWQLSSILQVAHTYIRGDNSKIAQNILLLLLIFCGNPRKAEELLLKHEDDELVLIVLYCFGGESPHSWSSHLYGS
jgi:hypothetical protein